MTRREYQDFEDAFAFFLKAEGVKHFSVEGAESHFSSKPCVCCSRSLGGDRYPVLAINAENEIVHYDVCVDCVYYNEYGQLDDTTMMEIEKDHA